MNIQPLGDRVVVEREEAKGTTAGGIVLPDTAKDKPQKGKVLAVGDGRITKDGKRRELQVKVGDSVLFTSYAGDEFKLDGRQEGPPDARGRHPGRHRADRRRAAPAPSRGPNPTPASTRSDIDPIRLSRGRD